MVNGGAAQLLGEAERAAGAIADESWRAHRQRLVAAELAAIDPNEAIRLAKGIASDGQHAQALADIAQALVATDPGWAADLLAEAERVVESAVNAPRWQAAGRTEAEAHRVLNEDYWISVARGAIVKVLAPTDADRALGVADRISDTRERYDAMALVAAALAGKDLRRAEQVARGRVAEHSLAPALTAIALAASDPGRAGQLLAEAERIAMATANPAARTSMLLGIAIDVAATDPGRAGRLLIVAERSANAIADDDGKWLKLSWVAKSLAPVTPEQALRVAGTIGEPGWAANARAEIAVTLAATDLDRAEGLLHEAERLAGTSRDRSFAAQAQAWVAAAKAEAVTVMSRYAPFRAERMARSIARPSAVPRALAAVGVALSDIDPARSGHLLAEAESRAGSLSDPEDKVTALTDIARVLIRGS